jgi:putative multiple sugar transport system substrate-binding protein
MLAAGLAGALATGFSGYWPYAPVVGWAAAALTFTAWVWLVISGQDAEVAAVKAIISGEQSGTIYKDTRELAKVAVQMSNAVLTGDHPITNDSSTYDNGLKVVPTYLLQPIAVDKGNYKTLLVDGGYYTEADLS